VCSQTKHGSLWNNPAVRIPVIFQKSAFYYLTPIRAWGFFVPPRRIGVVKGVWTFEWENVITEVRGISDMRKRVADLNYVENEENN